MFHIVHLQQEFSGIIFFLYFFETFVVEFSLNSDLLQCVSVDLFMLHETKAKISDYVEKSPVERRK